MCWRHYPENKPKNLIAKKIRYYMRESKVFKSMVKPYFDYGNIIFMGGSKVQLHKLQRLQNRALRICLGKKSEPFPIQELYNIAQVKCLTNRSNKIWTENTQEISNKVYKKQQCSTIGSIKIKMQCTWSQCSCKTKVITKAKFKRSQSNWTSAVQWGKQVLIHLCVMSSVNKFITKKVWPGTKSETQSIAKINSK